MKKKNALLAILAATTLIGATLSVVSADETGTGSTNTGTTNTGVTNTGITHTGVILPTVKHEMRDDRHEVRDMRQEGMQRVKDFCGDMKAENKDNHEQVRVNWDALRFDAGKLRDYLKNPLTAEEKTAVTTLLKTHDDARKVILSGTGTDSEKLVALKASLTSFLASVKTYVATDKVAAYDTFVAARLALFDSNSVLRVDNKTNMEACKNARKDMKEDIKQKAKEIKHVLSENTRNMLNAKLDAIPTEKKEAFYQKLMDRLDVLLAQPRSERVKAMLLEIKQIVQVRLDAFQTGVSEEEIVNEVLSQ